MTKHDLEVLDTIGTSDYMEGDLSDTEIDVPSHMVPPNPDDSDVLPSQVHPSYPYGNPTSLKHPASRPRRPYDPASRALFEDMGYAGGGVNGSLRWKDLALDLLLPVDEAKEEAERAAAARKIASGAAHPVHAPPPSVAQAAQQPVQNDTVVAEDEEDEDDEDDDDGDGDDDEDEDEGEDEEEDEEEGSDEQEE
ncbi:hypothetical protein BDY19DRAFT_894948 [Irpex rosettiformis]|uniref:Uncharacterized protein n=1 Tax=Irpex rosettiformis TaxID=378272 RepID=A0ACB8TWB7_9APHY|nr:hypothetical protein BDY19DRAFT_894948 [Irpex rosettiformis]